MEEYKNLTADKRDQLHKDVNEFCAENALKVHKVDYQKLKSGKHHALILYTPKEQAGVDAPTSEEIAEAIESLGGNPENFTKDGVPKIDAISKALGGRKVTGAMRDAVLKELADVE